MMKDTCMIIGEMIVETMTDIFGTVKNKKLAEVRIGRPVMMNNRLFVVTDKRNGKIQLSGDGINTYVPFEESVRTFVVTPDI